MINLLKITCIACLFFSCRKTNSLNDELVKITLNQCVQRTISNETITICLDSVIQDSRCPKNADCFWQGVAQARFSATINNQVHLFTLSTNTILPGTISDTTIQPFIIRFQDLHPHDDEADRTVYAEVKISR